MITEKFYHRLPVQRIIATQTGGRNQLSL